MLFRSTVNANPGGFGSLVSSMLNQDGVVCWKESLDNTGNHTDDQDYIWLTTYHPTLGWQVKLHPAQQFFICSGLTSANGAVAWQESQQIGNGSYVSIYYAIYDPYFGSWQIGSWYSGYIQNGTVSAPTISNAAVSWTAGGLNYKRGYQLGGAWNIGFDTYTDSFFVATPNRGTSPLTVWCIDMSINAAQLKYDFDGTRVTQRSTYHIYSGNCTQPEPVQLAYNAQGTYINSYGSYVYLDNTPPTGSILINGGAAMTASSSVTLTLSATDNCSVSSMRFSNDGSSWSAWEPYATSKAWTLVSGDGTQTAYVQYQDWSGYASAVYQDTILVDTPSIVLDVVDVSPDPRSNAISTVDVVLSKQIYLYSFTYLDVALTRNGSPVALDSNVTISLGSGSTYHLSGLSGFTGAPGNYVLTVYGSGIQDSYGVPGTGSASDTWVMCLPESGVIYVDQSVQGTTKNGSVCMPFSTVTAGYQTAQNGNTIRIFSGNYPEAILNMNKTLLLQATNGVVNIGR